MKRIWLARGLKFILFGAAAIAVVGTVVMSLWNALLPDLFGWHVISFWQALGLLVLSKILLGGWHGRGGHHMRWRAHMAERWDSMSEDERAKFREGMRRGCGPRRAAATPEV
jgi:hypothetical protein